MQLVQKGRFGTGRVLPFPVLPLGPFWHSRSLKTSGEHHIIVYRVQLSFVPLSGKELSGEKSWGDFVLADLSSIAGDTLPPPCWLLTPMEELWVDS